MLTKNHSRLNKNTIKEIIEARKRTANGEFFTEKKVEEKLFCKPQI